MDRYDVLRNFDSATKALESIAKQLTVDETKISSFNDLDKAYNDKEEFQGIINEIIDLARANELMSHPLVKYNIRGFDVCRYRSKIMKGKEKRIEKLDKRAIKKLRKLSNNTYLQYDHSTGTVNLETDNIKIHKDPFFAPQHVHHGTHAGMVGMVEKGYEYFPEDKNRVMSDYKDKEQTKGKKTILQDSDTLERVVEIFNNMSKIMPSTINSKNLEKFILEAEKVILDKHSASKTAELSVTIDLITKEYKKMHNGTKAYEYTGKILDGLQDKLQKIEMKNSTKEFSEQQDNIHIQLNEMRSMLQKYDTRKMSLIQEINNKERFMQQEGSNRESINNELLDLKRESSKLDGEIFRILSEISAKKRAYNASQLDEMLNETENNIDYDMSIRK